MWKSLKKFFDLKKGDSAVVQKSQAERVFDELSHKIEADEKAVDALENQTKRQMAAVEKAAEEDLRHVNDILR